MKLKFEKNNLIFKLSQRENEDLNKAGQSLTETFLFSPNNSFSYSLLLISDEDATIDYLHNQITLKLPCKIFETLSLSSKEGISFDFNPLKVTLIVDILPRKKSC